MENTAKTPLTKQEREQLFRALWNVADLLRGAMTADNSDTSAAFSSYQT